MRAASGTTVPAVPRNRGACDASIALIDLRPRPSVERLTMSLQFPNKFAKALARRWDLFACVRRGRASGPM